MLWFKPRRNVAAVASPPKEDVPVPKKTFPIAQVSVENLLPCPFCNGIPIEVTTITKEENFKNTFTSHIECQSCGCRTKSLPVDKNSDPFSQLKALWERRFTSQSNVRRNTPNGALCQYCGMGREYMAECATNNGTCLRALDET